MVDRHSGIYQETNGTGALMSHRCLPPTLSKMNAITVQNKCRHRTALFDHKHTGTVGDSYDNAMAESVNGAYKTELVWRSKPFRTLGELELATFQWVSWWNTKRLHASLDYKTPQQVENEYYEHQTAQAASL